MIATRVSRFTVFIAAALVVAGCGTTTGGFGLPWIKQGPGNTPEEGRAEREARSQPPQPAPPQARAPQSTPAPSAAQAPVNSRQIEVAPDLVAQTPPPPRTPAQAAAATAGSAASYTQATRYGDLVFVSGQIALDYGSGQLRGTTVEEQTRHAMENVRAVLESHRLTFASRLPGLLVPLIHAAR